MGTATYLCLHKPIRRVRLYSIGQSYRDLFLPLQTYPKGSSLLGNQIPCSGHNLRLASTYRDVSLPLQTHHPKGSSLLGNHTETYFCLYKPIRRKGSSLLGNQVPIYLGIIS